MTQLHEILAVESSAEGTAKRLIAESIRTMDKESLFKGLTRTLTHFSAEDKKSDGVEHQELTTTVQENLDYLKDSFVSWVDVSATKDATNQVATADLVIDGEVVATSLPVTFLLGMESKLREVRNLYNVIPTLAPGVNWVQDTNERVGVYKNAHNETNLKQKKDIDFRVVVSADEHHPAQVKEVPIVKDIGVYTSVQTSGMMAPVDKARLLKNIDKLIYAFKAARTRANSTTIVECKVGDILWNIINK